MKTCNTCGLKKSKSDFYKGMAYCKSCKCAKVRKRRAENPTVQAYDRLRGKLPHRKADTRMRTIEWRKDNPDGYKAQTAVGNAIRDGKLIKQPCQVCRSEDVEGHHEDYSKPLEVEWLCSRHHKTERTYHN